MTRPTTFICSLLLASAHVQAQQSPIDRVDAFYESTSSGSVETDLLRTDAVIRSIHYDSVGNSSLNSFTVSEFDHEIKNLGSVFEIKQTPLVLVERSYGNVASVYSSIYMSLKDRESGELLNANSIQSIKLIRDADQWKISSILIQNEHPSYPISADMLPDELLEHYAPNTSSEAFETYDTLQVYKVNEVDEIPVYPDQGAFDDVLRTYEVVTEDQPGYTPFFITIGEDGFATLSYAHDLSAFQIQRAESFARSMLVWYPAIKNAASVKCRLLFYIRE
ncbi:MAG: hypothetical protein R2813_13845 [Flavobacteriales bacterium]